MGEFFKVSGLEIHSNCGKTLLRKACVYFVGHFVGGRFGKLAESYVLRAIRSGELKLVFGLPALPVCC